ncbi:MAG: glycosyltransferase [Ferruginibacter sp.]
MKIVHCLNHYMPDVLAGTEVYTHTLATLQEQTGHEVAVITPHIEHDYPGQIKPHYIYDGIKVYQFPETANPTDRQVHYGKKKPEGLEHFVALLQQLEPDVIHFHELNRSVGFTVEHVKLARQSGAKVFFTMHLSSYSCNTNILIYNNELCDGIIRRNRCTECSYKALFNIPSILAKPLSRLSLVSCNNGITEKMPDGKLKTVLSVPAYISRIKNNLDELVTHVDQLISYSNWYKEILLKNGVPAYKITVVPAALVTSAKHEINKTFQPPGLPIKMVFVGRLQSTKGLHLIIEAMRSFSSNQVQMDIYGRPEETDYYKRCIHDTTEMDLIKWKGEIKREDVVECLSQYDIFCLASTFSEMSPLVIQEAFAAGIPVLASKVYGNIEQITHGKNGLLFEFDSSESLKEQIQALIENPILIREMKGSIVPPLNFNLVNESYLRIYASH